MASSYLVAESIDEFLAQLTRLVGNGYYFYFYGELKPGKDVLKLDATLIHLWHLDRPYWRREKRRRGRAPGIWGIRYRRRYLLISTHGTSVEKKGEPHLFFREYELGKTLHDIRKQSLNFCGYAIRYTLSKDTGRRRLFVRLSKQTYAKLRDDLATKAIRQRYACRDAFEDEIRSLPYQWYRPVREQLKVILKEVNRRRRYSGFEPVRLSCIPAKMRVVPSLASRQRARQEEREPGCEARLEA